MDDLTSTDITEEEHQAWVDRSFEIEQRVKASLRAGRAAIWELSKALHEFDEARGWQSLGYEDVTEWLADPEIGIKSVSYYRAIRRWRQLSRKIDVSALTELDPTKVDIVMPMIQKNSTELPAVLDDVKTLGWRDLREKYVVPSAPIIEESITGVEPDLPALPEGTSEEQAVLGELVAILKRCLEELAPVPWALYAEMERVIERGDKALGR